MLQEVSSERFCLPANSQSVAYTLYAFFEWALILFDVAFDAITIYDFSGFEIIVRDTKGLSRGYVYRLPK